MVHDTIIWGWKKYNDYFGLGEILTASFPVYSSSNELLGVYGIDFSMNEISTYFPGYESDLDYYIERNGQCTQNNKVSLCSIEKLRLKKCNNDSKSFENLCKEEETKRSKRLCTIYDVPAGTPIDNNKRFMQESENLLINKTFRGKKFYCDEDLYSEYKFFNNENNDKSCCLAKEELNKKLLFKVIIESKPSTSTTTKNDTIVSNDNSTTTSTSQTETKKSEENVDHLVTPLEDDKVNNSTTTVNTEKSTNVINDQSNKDNENTPKPENKSLYIVIILIIAVMIFVIWHLRKNQPRSYTNNTELTQSMNQSNRTNMYS